MGAIRAISLEIFTLNIKFVEALHQKYGLHPVQNGCEIRTGKTRVAIQHS